MYARTPNLPQRSRLPVFDNPEGLRIGCFSLQKWLSHFGAKDGQLHCISTCLRAARYKHLPILKRKIRDNPRFGVREMAGSTTTYVKTWWSKARGVLNDKSGDGEKKLISENRAGSPGARPLLCSETLAESLILRRVLRLASAAPGTMGKPGIIGLSAICCADARRFVWKRQTFLPACT